MQTDVQIIMQTNIHTITHNDVGLHIITQTQAHSLTKYCLFVHCAIFKSSH